MPSVLAYIIEHKKKEASGGAPRFVSALKGAGVMVTRDMLRLMP